MKKAELKTTGRWKLNVALAIFLISICGLGYALLRTQPQDTKVAGSFPMPPFAEGGGNPEQMRDRLMDDLELTKDQRQQIDAFRDQAMQNPSGGPVPIQVMEQAYEILTPEQKEKADAMRGQMEGRMGQFMAERMKEAKETLSPEDFTRFQEKAEERRNEMRERMDRIRQNSAQ